MEKGGHIKVRNLMTTAKPRELGGACGPGARLTCGEWPQSLVRMDASNEVGHMSGSTVRTKDKDVALFLRVDKLEERITSLDEKVAVLHEVVAHLSRKVNELETRLHEEVD